METMTGILMELSMAACVVFGAACLVAGIWCERKGGE